MSLDNRFSNHFFHIVAVVTRAPGEGPSHTTGNVCIYIYFKPQVPVGLQTRTVGSDGQQYCIVCLLTVRYCTKSYQIQIIENSNK